MKLGYLWRGVLSLKDEPAGRAVSPIPHAEKEQAGGG